MQPIKELHLYTDGSFNGKFPLSAYVVVDPETNQKLAERAFSCAIFGLDCNTEAIAGRQVFGELKAVTTGIRACLGLQQFVKHKLQITVFYDYTGINEWICDLWEVPPRKPWKRNTVYAANYRKAMECNYIHLVKEFKKVKSHSGNTWNEYVDKLMENLFN